jgi:hypothetical protein
MEVKTICQVKPEEIDQALAIYITKGDLQYPNGAVSLGELNLTRETDCTLEVRDGYLLVGTPALSLAIPIEDVLEALK